MKWTTETEVIDGDTGEVIKKSQVKSGQYLVISKIKLKSKFNEKGTHGTIRIRWVCRRNNQTDIWPK